MPELPDVERYRQFFGDHAAGKTVRSVWSDPTILRNTTPEGLDGALRGHRFEEPRRLGKWLIASTDGPDLLLHFGMTGDLIWSGDQPERHRHDRLILSFREGGELRYRNMRKLGGAWLAHDAADVGRILGPLGPDALGTTGRELRARLAARRGQVKPALMDQRLVAGVGNILADEILWQARLHPRRRIETLGQEERRRLVGAVRRIVGESVRSYDSIDRRRSWLTHVRGLPGASCPRCRTELARTVAGGRTTWFCPHCQA